MRKLSCLILVMSLSVQISFAQDSLSASVDANMAAQKTACAKNTAMEWSSKLNRCIGKQSAVDARKEVQACDSLTDVTAKKNCQMKIAEKSTGLSSDTGSLHQGNTTGSMVMNTANSVYGAYTVLNMMNNKATSGENSNCMSKKILGITGAAGLASDVFLKMKAKKKVKELEGKYLIDTKSTAYEAQVKALEYLKEEQNTVVSIASMEKKRNMMLMAGYALATGYAVYELTPYGANPDCVPKKLTDEEKQKKLADDRAKGIEQPSPTPDQQKATDTAAASSGMSAEALGKLADSSYGVIVFGGISTVYSKILYDGAEKQEKESKANVEKVDKMIASFKDSYASYCPSGREDMKNAKCYCYSADGTKNASRTNSQTCIDLWNKDSYLLDGTASNYDLAAYSADVAGCIMSNGVFDEACKCKKMVDAKGANACKKETSISLPNDAFSTGLATAGGASDLLKYASNTSNGNPRFDLLNTATLGNQAIKSRQMTDAIVTKLDKDVKMPNINASNVDKYAKAILGEKNIANKMGSGSMAMNVASARSDNPVVANALKAAEAKAGLVMSGGNGINAKKEKKKGTFDFNMGGDNSSGNSNGQVVGGFPEEKNYKFKNSDIATDNSASIFEIISNRYVQSGLKRLFEDGEETK